MDPDSPLVSIITPTYNSASYIQQCMDSVMAQTYGNFEMIIIDDASSDETQAIVRSRAKDDARIVFIQLPVNSGPAIARNTGIERASGRYLAFLDADDLWLPDFLKRSIETINTRDCGFVFSSFKRVDEDLNPLLSDYIVPDKVTYSDILKSNSIGCLTAFIDMERLGKKYMPLIRKRQDMGLWLSYLKEIEYAVGIKEPLAIYRIRKNSLSGNKWALLGYQWEFYRKHAKLSFFQALYYMAHWSIRGFLKYKN